MFLSQTVAFTLNYTVIILLQKLITGDRSCQNWKESAFIMVLCRIILYIIDNYEEGISLNNFL